MTKLEKGNIAFITLVALVVGSLSCVWWYYAGKSDADRWWQAQRPPCDAFKMFGKSLGVEGQSSTIEYDDDTLTVLNATDPKNEYTITFPATKQAGICGYEVRRDSLTQFTFKPIVKCEAQEPKDAK